MWVIVRGIASAKILCFLLKFGGGVLKELSLIKIRVFGQSLEVKIDLAPFLAQQLIGAIFARQKKNQLICRHLSCQFEICSSVPTHVLRSANQARCHEGGHAGGGKGLLRASASDPALKP